MAADNSLTVEDKGTEPRTWAVRLHPHPGGVYGDEYYWSCLVTDMGGGLAEISLARAQYQEEDDPSLPAPRRLSVSDAKMVYAAIKGLGFTRTRFERHNLGDKVRTFEREL